jgi:hypothetical protein
VAEILVVSETAFMWKCVIPANKKEFVYSRGDLQAIFNGSLYPKWNTLTTYIAPHIIAKVVR